RRRPRLDRVARQVTTDVRAELGRRRVARRAVLGERLEAYPVELVLEQCRKLAAAAQTAVACVRVARGFGRHAPARSRWIEALAGRECAAGPRRDTRQQLIEHGTEGPHVGAGIDVECGGQRLL